MGIAHKMSMVHKEIYFWESIVIEVSYLVHMTLYYKMRQILLQNALGFFITKCDSYYKMRPLIQNASVH